MCVFMLSHMRIGKCAMMWCNDCVRMARKLFSYLLLCLLCVRNIYVYYSLCPCIYACARAWHLLCHDVKYLTLFLYIRSKKLENGESMANFMDFDTHKSWPDYCSYMARVCQSFFRIQSIIDKFEVNNVHIRCTMCGHLFITSYSTMSAIPIRQFVLFLVN